jgi:carbon storage regulator
MLILIRRDGDTIILDGGIEITVSDIQCNHVKFTIDTPKEVKIYREEIYKRLPDYYAPPYG